jgi:FkbM family methyltransferase
MNNKPDKTTNTDENEKDSSSFFKEITPFLYGKALTYVDIGAHVGSVYKAASKYQLYIRNAHLIEPNPDNYKELIENIDNKRKGRAVHCHNLAIGAEAGFVTMQSEGTMSQVLRQDEPALRERKDTFKIEAIPLDLFTQQAGVKHINLLKVDVEGFEMEVLAGARELLTENRIDVIYIEAGLSKSGEQHTYYRSIEDYLAGFGYRIFRIYEQKNEWLEDSAALRRANFAFMSDLFLARNPYKVTMQLFEARRDLLEARREPQVLQRELQGLQREIQELQRETKELRQREKKFQKSIFGRGYDLYHRILNNIRIR